MTESRWPSPGGAFGDKTDEFRRYDDVPARDSIVLVTRNFPPMQGGMEWLNFHIHRALSQIYRVFLVAPKGAETVCPDPATVRISPALPVWRFLLQSFWQTLRLTRAVRPRLIVAGSGVAALPAVLAGRHVGIPVVTYLHGLDIVSAHPGYRCLFLPAIRRSSAWLANSRFTREAAIQAGLPPERVEILVPGTDLPALNQERGTAFRRRLQAGERPILLSVGRLIRRKGLLEFLERAFPAIVRRRPEVLWVIIGADPRQSLARPKVSMAERLRVRVQQLGLEAHVRLLDWEDDRATLGDAFLASRLHIFPVLNLPGDGEGFGMVAIEAAAHGVPTVAFAVGGIPDAVEPGVSGELLPSGDYARMVEVVVKQLDSPEVPEAIRKACRRHAERYAWPLFGDGLRAACAKTIAAQRPAGG
ncbi:glycosyltransferase family 4 protein [Candidatus Methylocalor cossyra]|uniref:GDP-mannose-dependent alpha-(1-6)-phosphatidylinositol monomannoside mannosyltransferase n=1 Tax=Candidatus Methylocalor cossyra TaxID=3108543 RepID=A0ABM9NHL0_9GAMM